MKREGDTRPERPEILEALKSALDQIKKKYDFSEIYWYIGNYYFREQNTILNYLKDNYSVIEVEDSDELFIASPRSIVVSFGTQYGCPVLDLEGLQLPKYALILPFSTHSGCFGGKCIIYAHTGEEYEKRRHENWHTTII
jgi:hypothetical protein